MTGIIFIICSAAKPLNLAYSIKNSTVLSLQRAVALLGFVITTANTSLHPSIAFLKVPFSWIILIIKYRIPCALIDKYVLIQLLFPFKSIPPPFTYSKLNFFCILLIKLSLDSPYRKFRNRCCVSYTTYISSSYTKSKMRKILPIPCLDD